MELSTQSRRRRSVTAGQAVSAANLGYQIGQSLAQQYGKNGGMPNVPRVGRQTSRMQTKIGPPPAPRKSKAAKQTNRNQIVNASIPGGLGTTQTLRATFKDLITITNGSTAGVSSYAWNIGFAPTSSGGAIVGLFNSAAMPRVATVSTIYRQFKVNRLSAQFVPFASTATSGAVAFGVDPDPSVVLPTTIGGCLRHRSSTLNDLMVKSGITYGPLLDGKKDPRYTIYQQGRTDDEMAFGVLQLYSVNSLAANATVGYMFITVDITFSGPL